MNLKLKVRPYPWSLSINTFNALICRILYSISSPVLDKPVSLYMLSIMLNRKIVFLTSNSFQHLAHESCHQDCLALRLKRHVYATLTYFQHESHATNLHFPAYLISYSNAPNFQHIRRRCSWLLSASFFLSICYFIISICGMMC